MHGLITDPLCSVGDFESKKKHYQDNKEDFDREFAQRRNDELKQTPNKAKVCVDGFDISPTVGIRHVVAYDS